MTPLRAIVVSALLVACGESGSSPMQDATPTGDGSPLPPFEGLNIEYVGHAALDEDANLGLAIAGNHAYVGHDNEGEIDIVDISNPAAPSRVGGLVVDWDSTELRAIPELDRLYVLTFGGKISVFDIANRVSPTLLGSTQVPSTIGHEFFLWRDPATPARVLLFVSDVSTNGGYFVLDVSDPAQITTRFRQTGVPTHAVALNAAGTRLYASQIRGQFRIFDATMLTGTATADLTAPEVTTTSLVDCTPTSPTCIAHSAVEVPGRGLAVVTYENSGCPKGFMNIVDISDETTPRKVATRAHPMSDECGDRDEGTFGYGPHDPTTTANLALVSWYRAGFLIFDLADPATPTVVGSFIPTQLPSGTRGDWGAVASVSYPIVKQGLIYVVDGRNGLDIFRYTGPHHEELDTLDFLEGNSNL